MSMYHRRTQAVVQLMAFLAWSVLAGPVQGFDGNSGPTSTPNGLSGSIFLIPLRADRTTATAGDPTGEAGAQSADSLNLVIEHAPFEEDTPLASGETTAHDWLDEEDNEPVLRKIPASHNLLPNLFRKKKQEADVSVKGTLLMDEDEEEITDRIDGAGVSIKYITE